MVTERNDSHRKTIVLLKQNVNFLLTGTVCVSVCGCVGVWVWVCMSVVYVGCVVCECVCA